MIHIVNDFILSLDNHLEANIEKITCDDLAQPYFRLIDLVSLFPSNKKDFTGFTELLIIRAIFYAISNLDNITDYQLIPNCNIGKREPDVAIYYRGELKAIVSVKSNMDNGYSRINKDFYRTKEVVNIFPTINTLTIAFDNKVTSGQLSRMEKFKDETEFYNFIFLKGNHNLFIEMIRELIK